MKKILCAFLLLSTAATFCEARRQIAIDDFVVVDSKSEKQDVDLSLHALAAYKNREYMRHELSESGCDCKTFSAKDGHAGIVTKKKAENGVCEITIAFRGTENHSVDWFGANLNNFWGSDLANHTNIFGADATGSVHYGFLKRYLEIRDELTNLLSESLKGEDLKNVKIRFTGHSLGGALATIATADFVNNLKHNNTEISKENISLTTFGSPRVFSPDAAGWFNKILSNNVTRYWRGNDPVSAVTPGFLGFKHVGESHKLPSDFTSQLFYNPMNLLKGLLDEHKTETYVRNIDKLPEDHTSFWARQYQYVGSFFRKAVSFFSW